MRDKLKIVVFIAKDAQSVEDAIRGGDYTWEAYPDTTPHVGDTQTEDLIEQVDAYVDVDYRDKITRRLRNADALLSAAKKMLSVGLFVSDFPRFTADLRKAIADYEEN